MKHFHTVVVSLLVGFVFPAISIAAPPKVGIKVPDFKLTRLDGSSVKFSQLKKKVVLVNFWASWCAPCLQELPSIQALWKDYKDKGFDVVAINADEDPKTAVPPVLTKTHIEFPVYTDPKGKLSEGYGVASFPYTMILDEKRRVLLIESRDRDWNSAEVRAKLDQWLK